MVDLEATSLKIAPWMAENLCFVSFGLVPCAPFVKYVCIESMRRTAHSVGAVTPRGAWDFQWGDVPKHIPSMQEFQDQAAWLVADITDEQKDQGICRPDQRLHSRGGHPRSH